MTNQFDPNTEGFLPRKKITKRQIIIGALIAIIILIFIALIIAITKL
jgi:uncharacterized BrkB/YihY/UPF0761 family membrane protein